MKQTKKFLRSKSMLRDIYTFRWGFPLGFFNGSVAMNGTAGTLKEPITLESIQKAYEDIKWNSPPPLFRMDTYPMEWGPLIPRATIFPMDGI